MNILKNLKGKIIGVDYASSSGFNADLFILLDYDDDFIKIESYAKEGGGNAMFG